MRRWPIALAVAVVAAGGGLILLRSTGSDATDSGGDAVQLDTTEVVRTSLTETTTYDGTLGRTVGEPITTARDGVVTSTPTAGVTLGSGDVLFEIDGEPVVALAGELPAYRDLTRWTEFSDVLSPTEGVVTGIPAVGDVIEQGDTVFEIDGQPIIAIEGTVPPYRDLRDESDNLVGDDVAQLEAMLEDVGAVGESGLTVDDEFTSTTADVLAALQAWVGADDDGELELGEYIVIDGPQVVGEIAVEIGVTLAEQTPVVRFVDGGETEGDDVAQLQVALVELGVADDLRTDGVFDEATAAAVRELQSAAGLEVDGSLAFGELVFIPGSVRVADVVAGTGTAATAGATVLEVTGSELIVSVELPAADQGTLTEGQHVVVELPDGTEVDSTVTSVAGVATLADDVAVFSVEVELSDTSSASELDEAPVEVHVVTDSADDVLAVPVSALVVLREGGYAVEVMTDGAPQLRAVEPGFFADGYVEVDGDVAVGDLVVVP